MSTTCPTCGREKHEGDCTDRVEWCASMLSFDGPLLRAAVAARVAAAVEAERQRIALRLDHLADEVEVTCHWTWIKSVLRNEATAIRARSTSADPAAKEGGT